MGADTREFRVGLVVVLALAVLILGLMWARGYKPGEVNHVLNVAFPNVAGLVPGDPVHVAGVRNGEIQAVQLRRHDVLVTLALSDPVKLSEGYRFQIVTLNFTGEKGVEITLGLGAPVKPPDEIAGTAPMDLGAIAAPVKRAAIQLGALADSLSRSLPSVLRRLDLALGNIDALVQDNRIGIRNLIAETRSAIGATEKVISTIGGKADTTLTALTRMVAGLQTTMAAVRGASDSLSATFSDLRAGKGTMGQLLTNDTLYTNMRIATARFDTVLANIDSLVIDLRRNPRRYVKFSVF